jgi:hypothetical protein
MKTALKISSLLNLGLAGGLFYILAHQRPEKGDSAPAAAAAASRPAQTAVCVPPAARQVEPPPFRWSQLESTNDYRVYVANLRAIGCPEPTVEDIVRGDAERAFFMKRRELHLDGSGTGPWSAQAQMRVVACLLGETPAGEAPAADVALPPKPDWTPLTPLVVQNVDLNALGLNEDQKEVVARIKQQFVDAVGGPNQDPNDPAYLARWQKSQREVDNMLRGMLGRTVFQNYLLAAQQTAPNPESGNP